MQGIKGTLEHFDFTYANDDFDETEAERVNGSELSPAIAIPFVCRPSAECFKACFPISAARAQLSWQVSSCRLSKRAFRLHTADISDPRC